MLKDGLWVWELGWDDDGGVGVAAERRSKWLVRVELLLHRAY